MYSLNLVKNTKFSTKFSIDEYLLSTSRPLPQHRQFSIKNRYVNRWTAQIAQNIGQDALLFLPHWPKGTKQTPAGVTSRYSFYTKFSIIFEILKAPAMVYTMVYTHVQHVLYRTYGCCRRLQLIFKVLSIEVLNVKVHMF